MLKAFCLLLPLFCVAAEATTDAPSAKEEAKQTTVVIEQTLSIIKPDAVENNVIGEILEYFETAGLKVVASKMTRLTPEQAKAFCSDHKDKPFFASLIEYMTSGPIVVQVLEGENAIALNRQIMGVTDPSKAAPGTLRADFGKDITHNAIHGSDSKDSAKSEISFFFKQDEIFSQQ